jgi:iron complex transport system substrate-binding protein
MTKAQPKRVVSLIASATEMVCALGARDLLVGRSHECDFPPDVTRLPSLTEPKFPVTGTSYDIDARVKAILQEGLSVYRVDPEKLQALRPDIIVTQDHCEVCAVSLKDVESALCAWGGLRVEIVSLQPDSLADIWEDITKVSRALGRERQGDRLVEQLKARMASIAEQSGAAQTRPRVASGFDMARTLQEMPLLERRPGWHELKAVQRDRVFVADGNHYFNRPGPRIVESLEILAEIFHPELFPSQYEGKGWMRYTAEPRVEN